ncbi:hypothetical protein BJ741DRAFT_601701 [Chytriomyces cf. hyalinus JEL632]|nr:hypothetical protein BJ741DRAFT_601701 [Chytriomyces cf. hyalinus JEL632]
MAPQDPAFETVSDPSSDFIATDPTITFRPHFRSGWTGERGGWGFRTANSIQEASPTTSIITTESQTSSLPASATAVVAGFVPTGKSFETNTHPVNTAFLQGTAYATSATDSDLARGNGISMSPLAMILGGLGILALIWVAIFCCVCFHRKRRSTAKLDEEDGGKSEWVPPSVDKKEAVDSSVGVYSESDYFDAYSLPIVGEDVHSPPVKSQYSHQASGYLMPHDALVQQEHYNMFANTSAVENNRPGTADPVKMDRNKSSASSVYPDSMFFSPEEVDGAQVEYEYNAFTKDLSRRKSIADEWRSELELAMIETSSKAAANEL